MRSAIKALEFVILFNLVSGVDPGRQAIIKDLQAYAQMFRVNYQPSVADFECFYPGVESYEDYAFSKFCLDNGLTNPNYSYDTDPCGLLGKKRDKNPRGFKSFYFEWLRKKAIIPTASRARIIQVVEIGTSEKRETEPWYQRISTNWEGIPIIFFRNLNEKDFGLDGRFYPVTVNGVDVQDLFSKDGGYDAG